MESEKNNGLICTVCKKEYSSTSTRNRHMRNFHPESIEKNRLKKRIICPMCTNEKFSNNSCLINHLNNVHHLNITKSVLHFRNFEEFTAWRAQENRDVNYACHRKQKFPNGEEQIEYICNRSDVRGFISTCKRRSIKSGGSIRIHGVCPSRIVAKRIINGSVIVRYVEKHVGHADKQRTKRRKSVVGCTSSEQNILHINEPCTSNLRYQDEENIQQPHKLHNFEEIRKRTLEEFCGYALSLDENSFFKFMAKFTKIRNEEQQESFIKKEK